MSAVLIYMTAKDPQEARDIVDALLEKRLIAGANIFPAHRSFFRWKGEAQETEEVLVIMKSVEDLFQEIEAEVLSLHSYETPCLVQIPVISGFLPFLQWIEGEVKR